MTKRIIRSSVRGYSAVLLRSFTKAANMFCLVALHTLRSSEKIKVLTSSRSEIAVR
jgi:hypothetical protein